MAHPSFQRFTMASHNFQLLPRTHVHTGGATATEPALDTRPCDRGCFLSVSFFVPRPLGRNSLRTPPLFPLPSPFPQLTLYLSHPTCSPPPLGLPGLTLKIFRKIFSKVCLCTVRRFPGNFMKKDGEYLATQHGKKAARLPLSEPKNAPDKPLCNTLKKRVLAGIEGVEDLHKRRDRHFAEIRRSSAEGCPREEPACVLPGAEVGLRGVTCAECGTLANR